MAAPQHDTRPLPEIESAPPAVYDRLAKDLLLRSEQLLEESMRALRRLTDAEDKFYAEEILRQMNHIHIRLSHYNSQRRRRLRAAGTVLG